MNVVIPNLIGYLIIAIANFNEIPACAGNKCGEYRSRTDDLYGASVAL